MKDIVEVVECSVPDVGPEDDEITRPANEVWPGWIPVAQDAGQKAAGTRSWIRPVPRVEPVDEPTLRDQFAMAALSGMDLHHAPERRSPYPQYPDKKAAEAAYQIADAMLTERERGGAHA